MVQNKVERQDKKNGLTERKRLRYTKLRWNRLTCRTLAAMFQCHYSTVALALSERFDNPKHLLIRQYVDALSLHFQEER